MAATSEGLAAAHLAAMVGRTTGSPAEGRNWEASTLAGCILALDRRNLHPAGAHPGSLRRPRPVVPPMRSSDVVACSPDHGCSSGAWPDKKKPGAGWRSGPWAGRLEPRYATGEIVAAEGRLVAAVAERPFEVTVITYRPGERARALDELSRNAGAWSAQQLQVAAVAPGWRAAASLEATTGIESVSMPALPPSGLTDPAPAGHRPPGHAGAPGLTCLPAGAPGFTPLPAGDVLVIADAQCFSTAMLQQMLELGRAGSAQLLIFGPAADFAERGVLAAVARAREGACRSCSRRPMNSSGDPQWRCADVSETSTPS